MNARKIAITALGSLLLAGTVAQAAPHGERDRGPGPHGPGPDVAFVRMLKLADADKDGKVTKEEADAAFMKIFDAIDANKDGVATPGEFRTYVKARMEAFRKDNPPPENGQKQAMKDDGKPDGRHGPQGKHHADREGGRHGEGHRWFGMDKRDGKDGDKNRLMHAGFILRQADTDQNGQVSREEAKAFGDRIFARMDVNKDGVISVDDLPDRPFP